MTGQTGHSAGGIEHSEIAGSYFCCECLQNHHYRSEIWEEHREHAFNLSETVLEALADVAVNQQVHRDELIVEYVERGLQQDLERSIDSDTEQGGAGP